MRSQPYSCHYILPLSQTFVCGSLQLTVSCLSFREMPRYNQTGYIDFRDGNWLGHRFRDALKPQVDKILANITANVGGWEGWAQFELMSVLARVCREAADIGSCTDFFGTVLSEFLREERYPKSSLMADFCIRVSCHLRPGDFEAHMEDYLEDMATAGVTDLEERQGAGMDHAIDESEKASELEEGAEFYFVELKCRSTKETDSAFVYRVKKDIDKVFNADFDFVLRRTDVACSAWIVAISVGNTELDQLMYNAAMEKAIEWQVLLLSEQEESAIKIWTYERQLAGGSNQSLFSYATQKSLTYHRKYGKFYQPPEPVMHPDDCGCFSCRSNVLYGGTQESQ